MPAAGAPEIIDRTEELLWVIARCDVENITAHRGLALAKLQELERRAAEADIHDLYAEVVRENT